MDTEVYIGHQKSPRVACLLTLRHIYNVFIQFKIMRPRRPPLQSSRLLDQVRERIRYLHYSLSTEKNYLYWIRCLIRWHGLKHPRDMSPAAYVLICTTAYPATIVYDTGSQHPLGRHRRFVINYARSNKRMDARCMTHRTRLAYSTITLSSPHCAASSCGRARSAGRCRALRKA
jgi:hypothetical protein